MSFLSIKAIFRLFKQLKDDHNSPHPIIDGCYSERMGCRATAVFGYACTGRERWGSCAETPGKCRPTGGRSTERRRDSVPVWKWTAERTIPATLADPEAPAPASGKTPASSLDSSTETQEIQDESHNINYRDTEPILFYLLIIIFY